ncbi:MAG TPA: hypothetical protein VGE52_01900 [Pirellulales bacterium]
MRVAIVYPALSDAAGVDESDVLLQVEAVEQALATHHVETLRLECSLDLQALRDSLSTLRPDLVFNLVEALGGKDDLHPLAPIVYDSLGIPYTGAPTTGLVWTAHKIRAKRRLREVGLPTADWWDPERETLEIAGPPAEAFPSQWIVKSLVEHSSAGLTDASVVLLESPEELRRLVAERAGANQNGAGRRLFAERYIAGREMNVGMIADGSDVQLLTPGEYLFSGFEPGRPHIVSYHTKWLAYHEVPRRFAHAADDAPLVAELSRIARRCWDLFDLRGYGRVDFRIDEAGRPFILEVNPNPCLTPDASFTCALDYAGISAVDAISRIVEASLPGALSLRAAN